MTDHSLLKTTILLLVSDPIVRSVLQETLEHEGYMVMATGDLGQAVDRLKECAPDLLITRTYVQGLPGHDAAGLGATSLTYNVLDDQRLRNREELEGFRVFPKPYSAADFLQKVKEVLAEPRG